MALDKNNAMALKLGVLAIVMVGASFAAVPFYRLFCQLTGFGGSSVRATTAPTTPTTDRRVTVSLNADIAPNLPWEFKPETPNLVAPLGVPVTTHYRITNRSQQMLVGTASHNIQPDKASPYFNKVECFCYTEQVLQPGESRDLTVTFFVDPDMAQERGLDDVQNLTLSYTFFLAKDQSKAKAAAALAKLTPPPGMTQSIEPTRKP
ncbi:MAG: cytochrome c oxidase assembly protein [Alphaproteobacteria bacterium]|nr:cytochrome c oxidase assembly protein [Alphaproteobacteria bacterium]